ncbi:MAG TPA: Tim44-like domain-containing protein [Quisquiliibacterium sp.]|nr:Tim44-like domain-containing protein [Quisquiliibacterium sp.]
MKILGKLFAIGLISTAMFAVEAEAKRLGGGKSVGRQSNTTMQRDAAPQQNAMPSQSAQTQAAARQNPAAAQAAQPARNRWLGPVAGLAAGLGLAALASHLGIGEELASFMLILLMVVAAVVVVRMIMARRAQPRPAFQTAGYQPDGVGSEASVRYAPLPSRDQAGAADMRAPVVAPVAGGASAEQSQARIPAGFDVDGFVRNAKVQFVRLQASFDAGDVNDLREFTSPEMFAELKMQIAERQGAANRTDVVRLDAELLGIDSGATDHVASVRFWGLVRENEDTPAEAFDEVWNLVKPVSGEGGWVLAGIQQLG